MSKKWIGILVSAIIIVLIGFNVWKSQAKTNVQVETVTLTNETMTETVMVPGTLILTKEQIVMYEMEKGDIAEIFVKHNDEVKKGDKLLRYKNEQYEMEKKQNDLHIRSLHLELDQLRKQHRQLDDELKKDKENELLQEEHDQIFLQEQLTNIELERALLERETIEQKIEQLTVTAAVDGEVLQLNDKTSISVKSGEKALMHLASLDEVAVRGTVSEYEALNIEKGQSVRLTADAISDKEWFGKVDIINHLPELSNQLPLEGNNDTVTYELNIKVDESIPLKPGFNMLIEIMTMEKEVATLPASAIQQQDEKTYVYIVQDGKVKRVDVTIGMVDTEKMEIKDGVTEEDAVIINPIDDVTEGMEVTVK